MKHKTAFYSALALAATAWLVNAHAVVTPKVNAFEEAAKAAAAAHGIPMPPPAAPAPAPEEPKTVSFHIDPALVKPAPELPQPADLSKCLAQAGPSGEVLLQAPGEPIEAACTKGQ